MWGLIGPEAFSADSASATVCSDEYDVVPDPVELGVLDGFTAQQFAYGQQVGVMDPEVYAYQALGAALASTASHFQNTFGPSNPTYPNSVSGDAVFVSDAYANVFGHPGSAAEVQHFVDQLHFIRPRILSVAQPRLICWREARSAGKCSVWRLSFNRRAAEGFVSKRFPHRH